MQMQTIEDAIKEMATLRRSEQNVVVELAIFSALALVFVSMIGDGLDGLAWLAWLFWLCCNDHLTFGLDGECGTVNAKVNGYG